MTPKGLLELADEIEKAWYVAKAPYRRALIAAEVLLRHPAAAAGREALENLLQTARLLQQNSEGCAVNHYGLAFEQQGLPGWLVDTQKQIDEAQAALALPAVAEIEGREVSLKFADAATLPNVKPGNLLACIVLTERDGKHASFAAYYLNAYPLEHHDCICPSEDDHKDDGCPTTGWFYNESNFEYDNCFHLIEGTILTWAPIPKSKEILAALARQAQQPGEDKRAAVPKGFKPVYVKRWRTLILVSEAHADKVRDALAPPPQVDTGREAVAMFFAQLILEQNGSTLNGNVTIRQQPIPASVYDKALAYALALRPERSRGREA